MSANPNGIIKIGKWTPEHLDGAAVNFYTGAKHPDGSNMVLRGTLKATPCKGGMIVKMCFPKEGEINEESMNQTQVDSLQQAFEVGSPK